MPSPQEETETVIAQAAKFDRLVSEPAWNDVLEHMADRINRAITDAATTDPINPYQQTIHVIRWNAMRELMDEALNYVKSTREERDRLMQMKREEEEYVNQFSNSR